MPQVREEFTLHNGGITRTLSINGICGTSNVSLHEPLPAGMSRDKMLSKWDKSFLMEAVKYPSPHGEKRVVRIADVFCGAGGLSYGVRESIMACGLQAESAMAVDIDPVKIEVYRRNFDPTHFSTRNLWYYSITLNYSTRTSPPRFSAPPKLLAKELQPAQGEVDILLGGPPCEGHSTSNNVTLRNDVRNKYYIVMPAMAVALGARAVIVENVPGVRHDHRNVLDNAKGLFESSGYYVDEAVVDAMALGIPQTRKRHILIASLHTKPDIASTLDRLNRPRRDLRWAIGDLMDIESDNPMDTESDLSEVNKRRIKYLFDNDKYNLPDRERPDSHKDGHTYPSIYGRLRWDEPSGTITTGFNTPGRGRYIHPERQRTITPHEAARIQGFPDDFEFNLIDGETPSRTSIADMIGDAVPPPMGYMAGVAALAALDPNDLHDR